MREIAIFSISRFHTYRFRFLCLMPYYVEKISSKISLAGNFFLCSAILDRASQKRLILLDINRTNLDNSVHHSSNMRK